MYWAQTVNQFSQCPTPQHALLGAILKIINARDEITVRKKQWVRF
jgi:hypothetical protein